jgi:GNAT superfamily N-acetyltransferase
MQGLGEMITVRATDGGELKLGPLSPGHGEALFCLFAEIVASREGFPQQPPLTRAAFDEVWARSVTLVVGAIKHEALVGAYYLKPNLPGMGSHIANAGYVVAPPYRRLGIGRRLVEDSILRAPLAGFDAVQFNFVLADNPARSLYEELGWLLIGTIPGGAGPGRDALIYWRAVA